MENNRPGQKKLDVEWIILMADARSSGFKPEDIRKFLIRHSTSKE